MDSSPTQWEHVLRLLMSCVVPSAASRTHDWNSWQTTSRRRGSSRHHGHQLPGQPSRRLLELTTTLKVLVQVMGLFVPKTFRSQERIVPMGNFRSRDFSFPGNESSLELSVPGNFHSLGTKVPWTFRSEELLLPGLFVPPTILQGIDYERRQL